MRNITKIKFQGNDVTNIYFGGYQTKKGIRHLYTQECWNVKVGDSVAYSKEKTVENCWMKWCGATINEYKQLVVIGTKPNTSGTEEISTTATTYTPTVVDWKDYCYGQDGTTPVQSTVQIRLNGKQNNKDLVRAIVDWQLCSEKNNSYYLYYALTDLAGETINLVYEGSVNIQSCFRNCSVDTVNLKGNTTASTIYAFRDTFIYSKVKTITSDRTVKPNALSGAFSQCTFSPWDAAFIDYTKVQEVQYMFDGGTVKSVPMYSGAANREDASNTISAYSFSDQMIWNQDMTYFGPVVDCIRVTNRYRMFQAAALSDIRIKNLNNGDWYFDDTNANKGGYLPNLDADSIKYLFDNLADLTRYVANTGFDLSTMTNDNAKSLTSREVVLNKRMATSNSKASCYVTITNDLTLNIVVDGLVDGDILGVGNGSYDTIQNKITTDGEYKITFSAGTTWGFKLWNNTSIDDTSSVTISPIGVASAELHCPAKWQTTYNAVDGNNFDDLVTAANAKNWTVFVGGSEYVI